MAGTSKGGLSRRPQFETRVAATRERVSTKSQRCKRLQTYLEEEAVHLALVLVGERDATLQLEASTKVRIGERARSALAWLRIRSFEAERTVRRLLGADGDAEGVMRSAASRCAQTLRDKGTKRQSKRNDSDRRRLQRTWRALDLDRPAAGLLAEGPALLYTLRPGVANSLFHRLDDRPRSVDHPDRVVILKRHAEELGGNLENSRQKMSGQRIGTETKHPKKSADRRWRPLNSLQVECILGRVLERGID